MGRTLALTGCVFDPIRQDILSNKRLHVMMVDGQGVSNASKSQQGLSILFCTNLSEGPWSKAISHPVSTRNH